MTCLEVRGVPLATIERLNRERTIPLERYQDDGAIDRFGYLECLAADHGVEFDVVGEVGDLAGVQGVTHVEELPDGVRVRVVGAPTAFLAALATRNITAVHGREASLEEIFLNYYDESMTA